MTILASPEYEFDRERLEADELPEAMGHSISAILTENHAILSRLDMTSVGRLARLALEADRVFVVGAGRSGLVMRMAAMRLMHLGLQVFVAGDTTTPALREGDLLIACSGSGCTPTVLSCVDTARIVGSVTVAITTAPELPLGQLADATVIIPVNQDGARGLSVSKQFAGTLFEQTSLLLFDAIFHTLAGKLSDGFGPLWSRHANLQ